MSKRSSQKPSKAVNQNSKRKEVMQAELRQQQRVELFAEMMLTIRRSLQLKEILHTTVTEVQRFLQADRVLIYHVLPNGAGKVISESVLPEYPALIDLEFPEEVFPADYQQLYSQGRVRAIADVHDPAGGLAECLVEFVEQFDIKAKLIVPIVQTLKEHSSGQSQSPPQSQNHLWGLLIAHQCRSPRHWVEFELELMQQLADQISIALSQAQLLEHLEARTAELEAVNRHLQQEINVRMQSEEQLRLITRMKNEFISVISHELRTPLTSLHSALKILATGRLGTLSSEGQQLLGIADDSTDRLVRLVNNVLDLQRIESGKVVMDRQACNAATLMIQAAEAMQAMAQQQGVALITQAADIVIWADIDYILQTLTNLLSNAIKFSTAGGTVWLTVEQHDSTEFKTPESGLHTPPLNAEAIFRVRDEGQGILADQLERIFEPFQQVDSSDSHKKGGTGLGLAICRRLVEQHNGRIWAESVPGCGSTFAFTLPAFEQNH